MSKIIDSTLRILGALFAIFMAGFLVLFGLQWWHNVQYEKKEMARIAAEKKKAQTKDDRWKQSEDYQNFEKKFNGYGKNMEQEMLEKTGVKKISNADFQDFQIWKKHVNRAIELVGKEDRDTALAELEEAFKHYAPPKQNASLYCLRGQIYYEAHDYEKAIKDLSKSITFNDPEWSIHAYFYRGDSHRFLENYDRAALDFLRVIQGNLDIPETEHAKNRIALLPPDVVKRARQKLSSERINMQISEIPDSQISESLVSGVNTKGSVEERFNFVVDNFYNKIESASGSKKEELLRRAIEGFQAVIAIGNDADTITVRQLSTYFMAQCYNQLGDQDNYIDALERVLSFTLSPQQAKTEPDTNDFLRSVRLRAEADLKKVQP